MNTCMIQVVSLASVSCACKILILETSHDAFRNDENETCEQVCADIVTIRNLFIRSIYHRYL